VLRTLRIRNYAIIEDLELEPGGGLTAFTGETGAGKSVIIGALDLALGGRARPEQVRTGAAEAGVEATFSGPLPPKVSGLLQEAGLFEVDDLVMRRVVPAGGKSRAYVNDRSVSLALLEQVGRELVDIHGQHQHQSLLRPETHLDFLDGYEKLMPQREAYAGLYARWQDLRQERTRLHAREKERVERLDFLEYQKNEIEQAGLRPGEEDDLRSQREILRHAERLAAAAHEAENLLYSGEGPAAEAVHQAWLRLKELAAIDPSLEPVGRVLEECQVQLEEAGRESQNYHRGLRSDAEQLEEIEQRLATIGRLKRKYGDSVEEILGRLAEIGEDIAGYRAGEDRLSDIDDELPALTATLSKKAAELSRRREGGRKTLEESVVAELDLLGLRGSVFRVDLRRREDAEGEIEVEGTLCRNDERGVDGAEFLLSANPGEDLKPLARVASGGELSRIMLAIKTVLAEIDRVPTLVFDEVDIGIGGKVARLVGDRLKGISAGRQVLCITHLPQIATLADSHYNIRKRSRRKRTFLEVSRLEGRNRTEEVARMLGGRTLTAATRKHAAEMLRGED
jgi:DNA repair protein RecN (Recombination protein N)